MFLKSASAQVTATVLDAISTIYTADNANYFLLEGQVRQLTTLYRLKPRKID